MKVSRWSCQPFTQSKPYGVMEPLLRRTLGLPHDLSRGVVGDTLTELATDRAPELLPWLPLIAGPFAADVAPTRESDDIVPSFRRARAHEAVAAFLAAVVTAPQLVVLEDTQWADEASLDMLGTMAREAKHRPWLICATSHGPDASVAEATRIDLQPLHPTDAANLALSTPAGKAMDTGVMANLLDRAHGNALFVVELMAASESGALDDIPDTVEALVTARLDAFSPADRVLVQEASVFGMDIDLGLLGAVFGGAAGEESRWERLTSLVRPVAPGVFRFGHDLFRQTIYEGVSFRRRRELHIRIGELLETRRRHRGTGRPPGHALPPGRGACPCLEIPGGGGHPRRSAVRQRRGRQVLRAGPRACGAPPGPRGRREGAGGGVARGHLRALR